MSNILIIISNKTQINFVEKLIENNDSFINNIYIHINYKYDAEALSLYKSNILNRKTKYTFKQLLVSFINQHKSIKKILIKLRSFFCQYSFFLNFFVNIKIKNINRNLEYSKYLLQKYSIKKVLTFDDRVNIFNLACLKKNHEFGGINIILPLSLTLGKQSLFNQRKNNSEHYNFSEKIKSINHKLVFYDNKTNKTFSFYNYIDSIALSNTKIISANPWVLGGGFSDYVLTDNNFYKNNLLKQGCKINKIIITGHLDYDFLFNSQKSLIKDFIKIKKQSYKYVTLISLPPFFEHEILNKSEHFSHIGQIFDILNNSNLLVLVSLHPKMKKKQYEIFSNNINCFLIVDNISEVIKHCDIVISSNSSINIFAMLLNKIVINYDFFLNYDFFDSYEEIINLKTIEEFENKIKFFSNEANIDNFILKNNTNKYFSDVDKYANFKKNITNIILNLNEKIY